MCVYQIRNSKIAIHVKQHGYYIYIHAHAKLAELTYPIKIPNG